MWTPVDLVDSPTPCGCEESCTNLSKNKRFNGKGEDHLHWRFNLKKRTCECLKEGLKNKQYSVVRHNDYFSSDPMHSMSE